MIKWNLLDFAIPPKDPSVKKSKNKFRGSLYLHNIKGTFIDKRGWGIHDLDSPFTENFSNLSGYMDFSNFEEAPMQFSADIESSNAPISISGIINAYYGNFDLYTSASYLNSDKWAPYLIPVSGVSISEHGLMVLGRLYKTPELDSFIYSLMVSVDKVAVSLPKLSGSIQEVSGSFEFSNKDGQFVYFKQMKGLLQGGGVSATGHIDLDKKKYNILLDVAENDINQVLSIFSIYNSSRWSERPGN